MIENDETSAMANSSATALPVSLPELGKTMAEIDLETKQRLSHRGRACVLNGTAAVTCIPVDPDRGTTVPGLPRLIPRAESR